MMASGTVYESFETTYPARTVVCFSSMFTGAAP
jgi:predicted AlkP superfamily phosphohydrolase/phosphomutase